MLSGELTDYHLRYSAGVRNLLDADYADNTRINAFGQRYFEAGLPRHVYALVTGTWGRR